MTSLAGPELRSTVSAVSTARFVAPVATCGLFAAVVALVPDAALAQSSLPGRVEVSGGLQWTAAASVGDSDANETSGGGSDYRLFASSNSLGPATGFEVRLAIGLTRSIDAAFSAELARSSLRSALSSDVEGIPDVEVKESITQSVLEGTAIVHLPGWQLSDRTVPFVSAGFGVIRHLHEDRTLAETGTIYHLGGGLSYLLKRDGSGAVKSTGLRASVRAVVRHGGAALDDGAYVSPAVGIVFFARF